MIKVYATLKVLGEVVAVLTMDVAPEDADRLIPEELKKVMESDAAMTEEVAYNIIPLDAPALTNGITSFPEVRAAVSTLSYSGDLPKLPDDYPVPKMRGLDILDLLCFVFGFQKDNVSNQREHIILLLSNAQTRLDIPKEAEPEAAICNGKAPHSAWRNYDDFNEYFWSLSCFELGWPWCTSSAFFFKPKRSIKALHVSRGNRRTGKTCFVEHRTFLHLYHSFHRLWIFLVMMFQGLTILAFNKMNVNLKTISELLSLGPTFVIMKFIESILDILMMYGAYAGTRSVALSRMFLRFAWFGTLSGIITYLYVKGLQEQSKLNSNSLLFGTYIFVLGVYVTVQIFVSFLIGIPPCRMLTNKCDQWSIIRFMNWMHQEQYYVGQGLYERSSDYFSVSSSASFMSNQETSFVTLGQRVLAYPLKVRMHYGHPDVFDRIFHITRGGISKASRIINISEDIYAGFNSRLRQGNITHHEYIQVGKGCDVGLNQIAMFEGKVAGGNGEQVLSRDVYRLEQTFDFFKMLSFYFTTVGFYFCTMMTVLTVYFSSC